MDHFACVLAAVHGDDQAARKGEWVLLDEVNLAPPDTLQRLCGLLDAAALVCMPFCTSSSLNQQVAFACRVMVGYV